MVFLPARQNPSLARPRAGRLRPLLTARLAARTLAVGRSRFDKRYADYLRAAARHQEDHWQPGCSGGDHAPAWPTTVEPLLRKLLAARPPAPYRLGVNPGTRVVR